jgi:hypothetical protein
VDASPVGLAALLIQEGNIIAYSSRALTDVESRYSQTEKEALAIVWTIAQSHLYLYRHSFELISDILPLETIFDNPKTKPPAIIERWRVRLQQYNSKVKYKLGKMNAAYYLSGHPIQPTSVTSKHSQLAEECVRYLTDNDVPKAVTLNEIVYRKQKDPDLQAFITAVKTNRWDKSYENSVLNAFSKLCYELTLVPVNESIINEEKIEEISDGNNSDRSDTILRRSPRERRPPKYLDEYVCSK